MEFETPIIWVRAVDVLKTFHLLTRVQWSGDTEPTSWEHSLFIPTSGYLETGSLGPVPWQAIQWIEVDTVEECHIGRLVPPKKIDHSDSLINALDNAGLPFVRIDRVIRIQPEAAVNS